MMTILYPIFLQVFLTFAVLLLMGRARARSMRETRQTLTDRDVMLGRNTWTDDAAKCGNNFKNQFELPVLFYAAVAFAMLLKQTDTVMVTLAWAFALSRVVHAAIHIGPNIVAWRGGVYIFGFIALAAMWVILAIRVIGGSA